MFAINRPNVPDQLGWISSANFLNDDQDDIHNDALYTFTLCFIFHIGICTTTERISSNPSTLEELTIKTMIKKKIMAEEN